MLQIIKLENVLYRNEFVNCIHLDIIKLITSNIVSLWCVTKFQLFLVYHCNWLRVIYSLLYSFYGIKIQLLACSQQLDLMSGLEQFSFTLLLNTFSKTAF